MIVQEAYDTAIGDTLDKLTRGLIRSGADRLGADRAGDGRPVGNGEAAEYEAVKGNEGSAFKTVVQMPTVGSYGRLVRRSSVLPASQFDATFVIHRS